MVREMVGRDHFIARILLRLTLGHSFYGFCNPMGRFYNSGAYSVFMAWSFSVTINVAFQK
jgi:hypothetical protein